MAKKRKSSDSAGEQPDSPPKKPSPSNPSRKKKTAKKPAKKAPKRRARSRGKRRNPKSKDLNVASKVEAASGVVHDTPDVAKQNEPPEDFRPGPSVTLFDGNEQRLNREAAIVEAILGHPTWNIPDVAFSAIPHKLTLISLNMGKDDETGEENVADKGSYSTNQQLTAMRIIERLNNDNLRKLTALKPTEVRLLNDESTIVTTDVQRSAALAAIAAEFARRQSRGEVSGESDRDGDRGSPSGGEVEGPEAT